MFKNYFELIDKFKNNTIDFERLKTEIQGEFSSFFEKINDIDNTYFKTVDDELKKHKLYFYENLLIDSNIYDDVITYSDFIEKMIGNVEIDESRFNIISQSINKDLEVVGLLNDIMDDIIEYYNNKLKFGDDTHDYVSMSFHDNLENLNILKLKTTDYYTKSKYNTDVEDSNEYDLDNYVLTGEIEGELTNVKDNFNKYTRDISANYCSNKLNHKKY